MPSKRIPGSVFGQVFLNFPDSHPTNPPDSRLRMAYALPRGAPRHDSVAATNIFAAVSDSGNVLLMEINAKTQKHPSTDIDAVSHLHLDRLRMNSKA